MYPTFGPLKSDASQKLPPMTAYGWKSLQHTFLLGECRQNIGILGLTRSFFIEVACFFFCTWSEICRGFYRVSHNTVFTFVLLISRPSKHLKVPSWTFFNSPFCRFQNYQICYYLMQFWLRYYQNTKRKSLKKITK